MTDTIISLDALHASHVFLVPLFVPLFVLLFVYSRSIVWAGEPKLKP